MFSHYNCASKKNEMVEMVRVETVFSKEEQTGNSGDGHHNYNLKKNKLVTVEMDIIITT